MPETLVRLFEVLSAPLYWLLTVPPAVGYTALGILVAATIILLKAVRRWVR